MFSLKSLAEALQGGPEGEEDDYDEEDGEGEEEGERAEGDEEEEEEEGGEGERAGAASGGGPLQSFWGVASALTATVKAKTTEVLKTVQEVDWREELEAFQQGAKDDAEVVSKGADAVVHRAREAAEQLPASLDGLPGGAAALQARAEAAAGAARARAGRGLANLAGLGSKLVLSTHDLFEQISHAVQHEMALVEEGPGGGSRGGSSQALAGQARYSRFEADVAAMQRDSSTYCDEPEDGEDFEAWLAGFDLAARRPDVERLIAENTFMSELQARIVPLIVEYEAFWTRYFYRLYRLEQKHQAFQALAQRAQQGGAEEEVGWSSDDDAEAEAEQPTQHRSLSGSSAEGQHAPSTAAAAAAAAAAGAGASGYAAAAAAAAEEAAEAGAAGEELGELRASAVAVRSLASGGSDGGPAALPDGTPGSPSSAQASGAAAAASGSGTASPSEQGATASSDSDHWQVVRSPRQGQAAAPGHHAAAEPAALAEEAAAVPGEEAAAAPWEEPQGADPVLADPASRSPTPPAEGAGREDGAAGALDGGDDGELSDWGDDDEAALAAAAAGGGGGDDGGWGSDWE